jgi:hypothetical protein
MPTIQDVKGLEGHVTIDGDHTGDIICHTLTVTRRGKIRGNVICDTLENGGHITGIVICHLAKINTAGYVLGALYYQKQLNQGFVAPTCDFREPPVTVWAIVKPEVLNGLGYSFEAFEKIDLLAPAQQVALVPTELFEAPVVGRIPNNAVAEVVSSADTITMPEELEEPAGALILEAGPKAPKLTSQPIPAVKSTAQRDPSPQLQSTGRKVTLPGFKFGSQNTNA